MKPFIIGDKRFAFDVTNADDLRRLERACALLCAKNTQYVQSASDADADAASVQMRTIFGIYRDFFETVFPGHSAEIIGEEPSVSRAGRAFDRFAAFLRGCVEEEERNAVVMRRIYLGDDVPDVPAVGTGM